MESSNLRRRPQPVLRRASREHRRQQLIEATIRSLAERGYDATTIAVVADGAGLSRGIVNFHFDTKEKLLVETLRFLSEEYRNHWRTALEQAGPSPAAQLWSLVNADFDPRICNSRRLAAWCAFWGEAKSRPIYRALCGANDREYQEMVVALCADLGEESPRRGARTAQRLARGLVCLLEGLWLHLMMGARELTREEARCAAVEHLATVFPLQFNRDGPVLTQARAA